MLFILALCLAAAFSIGGHNFIKKYSVLCYILAAFISVFIFAGAVLGWAALLPLWVNRWVVSLFSRGALATALFVAVMYAGALPVGSRLIKILMPIRAELSILASILTLTHNATYGLTYFKKMFTEPKLMSSSQFSAGIMTIILLCIMLPLTVTSFKAVRKKMKPKNWKKLHRSAYLFYGLIYLHVMLLSIPGAMKGQSYYVISVLTYSIVFLSYGAMRARKAWRKKNPSVSSTAVPYAAALATLLLICFFTFNMQGMVSANLQTDSTNKDITSQPEKSENTENDEAKNQQDTAMSSYSSDTQKLPEQSAGQRAGVDNDKTEAAFSSGAVSVKPEVRAEKNMEVKAPVTLSEGDIKKAAKAQAKKPDKAADKPTEVKSVAAADVSAEAKHTYRNGSFSGSGKGYAGVISVSITVKDDVIKDIKVTKASEDEPYFSAARELIGDILTKQSTEVDTVSGATFSSKGIISAVNDALKNAKQ
jgi:DMSO/TMAO reductase YedYZ heme-binding membrane subunit/uncharacterized protein with FMN-binding domain